ncbi:SpoIID/LytB domain-containing protein [Nocardioides dilutus]
MTISRAPAALALVVAVLGLPTTAHAAADDWTIPDKATIRIYGHGYGHGHGMSQHGAQGAALQGLTHQEIVDFYYPGTTWGTAKGKVSVLITADTTKDVRVVASGSLRLRVLASGKVLELAKARPRATRWRITPVTGGRSQVSYRTSSWKVFRTVNGDAELFTPRAPTTLVLPKGAKVAYRGVLRSVKKDTVNVLPLDRYLQGVVPQEMPPLWEPEAVKAQAVAARTYAAYERAHPIASHYQICDTTSCQVYGGASAEHRAATAAIRASRGEVLLHDGAPAFTQFSASSGGWTSAGSAPYLVAQQDPYDGWSGNPHSSWQTVVSDGTVEKAFPGVGNLTRIQFAGRDGNGEWGGRVDQVTVTGDKGAKTVSGEDFRFLLGLRSEWVNLTVTAGRAGS